MKETHVCIKNAAKIVASPGKLFWNYWNRKEIVRRYQKTCLFSVSSTDFHLFPNLSSKFSCTGSKAVQVCEEIPSGRAREAGSWHVTEQICDKVKKSNSYQNVKKSKKSKNSTTAKHQKNRKNRKIQKIEKNQKFKKSCNLQYFFPVGELTP